MSTIPTPVEVFYSYAERDASLLDELEKHLRLLQREGLIRPWRDLLGAMNTAQRILRLKVDAIRVEVHLHESLTSDYRKKPLAAFSREDVPLEQCR